MKSSFFSCALGIFLFFSATAWADCNITPAHEETFEVRSCRAVDPYQVNTLMVYLDQYPKRFVESMRDQFEREAQIAVESYRGAVLETGRKNSNVRYFVQGDDPDICLRFPVGATIKAEVTGACCDGDINPPCYLGFKNLVAEVISVTVSGKNYELPKEEE